MTKAAKLERLAALRRAIERIRRLGLRLARCTTSLPSSRFIQHAVKKLLVAGGRGAGKDAAHDIDEAIDALRRWQDMRSEER